MRRAVLRSAFHLAFAATTLAASLAWYVTKVEARLWLKQRS